MSWRADVLIMQVVSVPLRKYNNADDVLMWRQVHNIVVGMQESLCPAVGMHKCRWHLIVGMHGCR